MGCDIIAKPYSNHQYFKTQLTICVHSIANGNYTNWYIWSFVNNPEYKIIVIHWPFSNQSCYVRDQLNNLDWTHLPHVCYGVIKIKTKFLISQQTNFNTYCYLQYVCCRSNFYRWAVMKHYKYMHIEYKYKRCILGVAPFCMVIIIATQHLLFHGHTQPDSSVVFHIHIYMHMWHM